MERGSASRSNVGLTELMKNLGATFARALLRVTDPRSIRTHATIFASSVFIYVHPWLTNYFKFTTAAARNVTGPSKPESTSASFFFQSRQLVNVRRPVGLGL